jgi:O-antigen/teichoic acid export membrane protein
VGPTTSALVLMIVVRRRVCSLGIRFDLGRCRGLLKESRFLAAQQLLLSGTSQAEMLLLPKLIGLASFGQFSAGALPANRMVVLPDAFCAIAFPEMVRAWKGEHGGRSLANLLLKYMFITVMLCTGLALVVALLAHPIAGILFPQSPSIIAEIIRITVWSLPLLGVELVLGYALTAAGRDAIQARLAVHASVLSLTTCLGLVSTFGLEGACWSMLMRPAIRAAMLAPAVIHLLNDASSPGLVTTKDEPIRCVELRDAA